MKEWYDKEYFDRWSRGMHYRPRLKKLQKHISQYNPRTVLDVGCGIGVMVKRLRDGGIDTYGMDFSPDAGKLIPKHFVVADAKNIPYPDNSFDVILASDFLEHIAEEDIDQVYSEMKRVGGKIVANIAFKKDRVYKKKDGEWSVDTHLTVKPQEWWEKKVPEVEIIN